MLTFVAQLSLDFIFGGIDKLPKSGEEVCSKNFDIQLGGGTLVYPIVLTRLGIPCKVLLKKSKTLQSEIAFDILKSYGIEEIEVEEVDYDPVMSTAVISLPDDRAFVSKNDIRVFSYSDEHLINSFKNMKIIFATEENISLLPIFKANDSKIVFDIGWSDDLDIKDYIEVLKYVDYFTPNDKEAMKLTNTNTAEESLYELSKYVKNPIVSCGENGCVALIDNQVVRVAIPKGIECVDTTGAGDNFMAGLIYGIYNDMSLLDTLKFANCTGAISTTKLGCYGASYSKETVLELFATL